MSSVAWRVGNLRLTGGGEALHAVIVAADFRAREIEAMDHPGLAVGNEQGTGGRVEREPAERGTRIRSAVERDIGEQADGAGHAVDAPDRSRPAALRRRSK